MINIKIIYLIHIRFNWIIYYLISENNLDMKVGIILVVISRIKVIIVILIIVMI